MYHHSNLFFCFALIVWLFEKSDRKCNLIWLETYPKETSRIAYKHIERIGFQDRVTLIPH